MDVRLLDGRGAWITAVTIRAAESHDRFSVDAGTVHVAHALVADHTTAAFGKGVGLRLPQEIEA